MNLTIRSFRQPTRLVAVFLASMLLSGLELGCKEDNGKEAPTARVQSDKLPPLEIVDGEAESPGSPPPKIVKIDQAALEKACAEAKLPTPPDLRRFKPALAQPIYNTLATLVENPSASAYGRFALFFRFTATEEKDLLRVAECLEAAKALEPENFEWPYRMGKVFWNRGSTERADLEFTAAEKLNSDYAMIHWWLGRIDLTANRADKAKAHFERFVKLRPDDAEGYTGIGTAYILAKDYEAARQALQTAVKLQPNHQRAHVLLSEVYVHLGEEELAVQERRTAGSLPATISILERDSLELAIWTQLPLELVSHRIKALMDSGSLADAVTLCEVMLKDHPDDDDLLTRLGRLFLRLGEFDKALTAAQQAMRAAPDSASAFVLLTDCYLSQGKVDEALNAIERAIQTNDKDAMAHNKRGRILSQKERYEEAEADFRRAVELEPTNTDYWLILSDALLRQKKASDAIDCCRRVLEFDSADPPSSPDSRKAYLQLGRIYASQGSLKESIENFKEALLIQPDDNVALAQLGSVLAGSGKIDEAVKMYRKAITANPNNAIAHRHLADVLAAQNKLDEALQHIRQAVKLMPNDAQFRIRLAEFLVATGKDSEAIEHLLAAVKTVPEHAVAHFMLGVLKNRANDIAAAKNHYEQAIKAAPKFVDVYLALSVLAIQKKDNPAAERYLREGLKNVPDEPMLSNALAWILATDPDPNRRNGQEAVMLAEKAYKHAKAKRHLVLDTVAAAYAEVGRFEDAVKAERDAIKQSTDAGLSGPIEEFKARLALYEAGKPYRED